jgi:glycosyltransferase involved in cell wall biosynthesis
MLRIGILANEFFSHKLFGGYGFNVRGLAQFLEGRAEVFLIRPSSKRSALQYPETLHGATFLDRADADDVRRAKLHVLLTLDYDHGYYPLLRKLSGLPLVVMVHDPRRVADWDFVQTLRNPYGDALPCKPFSAASLADIVRRKDRRFVMTAPAQCAVAKIREVYGVKGQSPVFLPYTLRFPETAPVKSAHPSVVFLARLDPIKRPWVVAEVARQMPDVTFHLLGDRGTRTVQAGTQVLPLDLPPNVILEGFHEGERKAEILGRAWALINTSVHESLPVSFVEALGAGCALVSAENPDNLADRFGEALGSSPGDGLADVPRYVAALRSVFDRRAELGEAGRAWALEQHGPESFYRGLNAAFKRVGIGETV